ncbi:hypothetical protein DL240_17470 [Lujinxingia litoralis]|uniref:Uncharacterized protein n=1 Tax=Lujinxingia litoralis TaxID=2211119 RepID=A0A328C3I2_9DELT|nr:hypothetical protein [Lujinxingia litoralis]RAL20371.1 hypothetical protein DL240_17470 [Lujinxingia litoralis]
MVETPENARYLASPQKMEWLMRDRRFRQIGEERRERLLRAVARLPGARELVGQEVFEQALDEAVAMEGQAPLSEEERGLICDYLRVR